MAEAMDVGILPTSTASWRNRPVRRMSTPVITKAPTAVANPPAGAAVVARSAAPGVDQAMVTGTRNRQEKSTHPRPMVKHRMATPEPASAGEAPTAVSPASTTAKDDENPTTAEITPARRASEFWPRLVGRTDMRGVLRFTNCSDNSGTLPREHGPGRTLDAGSRYFLGNQPKPVSLRETPIASRLGHARSTPPTERGCRHQCRDRHGPRLLATR